MTEQKGGLLSFGILAALWSSSSAVVAITAALNQAYDVEEGRPWWKVRGIALLLTMGLSVFLLLAVVLLIFGPSSGADWRPSWASVPSLKPSGIFCAGRSVRGSSRWRWRSCIICAGCGAGVEVDYARGDLCGRGDPARLARLFAVCQPLWVLQHNVWQSGRGDYLSDLVISEGCACWSGGEINAEIEHAAPDGKAPGHKTGA